MVSWNDFVDGLKGEVQDKSKNPFFGAFIITWCIRHWEAVFIIFNFEGDFSMDDKITRIQLYFEKLPKYDFWTTIAYTFGVIILGFFLLNLTRIISNVSEKIITPWIYRWTSGKASIVTKEIYNIAVSQERKAIEKLELEVERRTKLQSENDKLENELIDLKNKIEFENNLKNTDLNHTNEIYSKSRGLINQLSEVEKTAVLKLLRMIEKKEQINRKNRNIKMLETNNVITHDSEGKDDRDYFKLTPFGEKFQEIFLSDFTV